MPELIRLTFRYSSIFISSLCLIILAVCVRADEPDIEPILLDWVAENGDTSTCRGQFIDPLANEVTALDLDQQPIEVEADNVNMPSINHISIEGNIDIKQGSRKIHAETMSYNRESSQATLEGPVEIRQPGLLIRGQRAAINMAKEEASFEDGQFVLHETHLHGRAQQIKQQPGGVVELHKGSLTSCEPHRKAWEITGKKLRVDTQSRQGSGRGVSLKLYDIPFFYLPYITFPVGRDRMSGFLVPTIGFNDGEIDYAQPYYWNIAPNYDATLTPRYAAGHGAMFETTLRYLNTYSMNEAAIAYLPEDQGRNDPDLDSVINSGQITPQQARPFEGESRWLVDINHQGGRSQQWFSEINYNRASDIDYLRDLSVASFRASSDTFLEQSASVGINLDHWTIQARTQNFQNLLADLDANYRQLPRINIDGHYQWQNFSLNLENEYVNFSHRNRERQDGSVIITGERASLDYALNWQWQKPWLRLGATAGTRGLSYVFDDRRISASADDRPTLNARYASLDSALILERNQGRQVLTPRIYYLFRERENHDALFNITDDGQDVNFDTTALAFNYDQLFRGRRFAGGDRIDDADRLSIGVSQQWFDQSGLEYLGISLGQTFYFRDRLIDLSSDALSDESRTPESDIAAQIRWRLDQRLSARSDLLYNPESSQVVRSSIGLNYTHEDGYIVNFGHRFTRDQREFNAQELRNIDQLDVSFAAPITSRWRLFGRSFYDLDERKELDLFAGLEYDDCCFRLRVLGRRWLDSRRASLAINSSLNYDKGLFFEIELKGLGGSGKRISSLLEETITGFSSN